MSSVNEFNEIDDEPLDEQWWEREQEEVQLGLESDEHQIPPDLESYETTIDEQIDYANDEKQIKLAIERLENLRIELQDLKHRKTRVFITLTEQIDKGLCESDVPIRYGTKEEVKLHYEKLLMEFKNKKEAAVKRKHDLNEKLTINTEYLELKRKECAELTENQYNLELKTAVGMIYDKTQQKLTHNDVEELIETCKRQDIKLNKARLEFIAQKQKCKKIKTEIEYLAPSTFSIVEYQELSNKNEKLKNSIESMTNIKTQTLKVLKSELSKIPDIDKKLIGLKEEKDKNEAELKQIKDEWRRHVKAKAHDQKHDHLLKKGRKSDYFTENPLLLNDYFDSMKKDKIFKKTLADLRQDLSEIKIIKKQLGACIQ
ncbi:uncharacterized protein LOC132934195 [Metopolophium dirhodum]|uniref:uncharacterized protein LOC132934195 n=1 Tax=Metopolophium dirhodum TaxID=44670 RepID=UPI00298F80AC|nr:uncharacterized protein LOC132934195 [Metopolophium dirhodum]